MNPPETIDELAAALKGLESVAPERRAQAIACRVLALLVRFQAGEFAGLTQAEAAEKLGVSASALSRAGDRAEESIAVYRRGHRNDEWLFDHL
ncbi:MAG: hypothetical protein U1G08_18860 [Verrucomicrobiota bacterium]